LSQPAIKIGTRNSKLALYQANLVAKKLNEANIQSQIIEITSLGDENLTQPIYKLGTSGVFTKAIDTALLNHKVDIAVHSLKDVPTDLPHKIINLAILERSHALDVIKLNNSLDHNQKQTIATGSIRRKAQWLAKYPNHEVVPLRGNVNTRLKKLTDNQWTGAIFAKAGLDRLDLLGDNYQNLDWMIPAPAQGAIVVASLAENPINSTVRQILNHVPTETTTTVEREFMNAVEAGCSFPLGAIAEIKGEIVSLHAVVHASNGSEKAEMTSECHISKIKEFGKQCGIDFAAKHQDFINKIKSSI